MKLFCFCSPSHKALLDLWLDSTVNDPRIEPCVLHLDMQTGNGDYGNFAHLAINEAILAAIAAIIFENKGEEIGFTGCDVVFLKPFISEVESLLRTDDILFQCERRTHELINPDVSFMRCTSAVYFAYRMLLERIGEWDGNLPQQSRIMLECFTQYNVAVGMLPFYYASTDNGGLLDAPVLFHANCTPPPQSVEKKKAMLLEALAVAA